jgi:hypothetical protein
MRDTAGGTPALPFKEVALQGLIAYQSGPLGQRSLPMKKLPLQFQHFSVSAFQLLFSSLPLHACSRNKAANTNMKSEKN